MDDPFAGGPIAQPKRAQSMVVQSYLQRTDFAVRTNPAIQAVGAVARHNAVSRGWQHDEVVEIGRKEDVEKAVKLAEQSFINAQLAYQNDVKDKYRADVLIGSSHSWNEVLVAVEDMRKARYERKDFGGRLLTGLRAFGDKSAIFQQWTELLPTQNEYFAVLCGGLKLIFGAAARLKEIRSLIEEVLVELPTLLTCTNKTAAIFDSADLHVCSRELMAKTFTTLQWVVYELRKSAIKKGLWASVMQKEYANDLSASIKDVRVVSGRFSEIARTCAYGKLGNIEKVAVSTRNQVVFEHDVTNAKVESAEHNIVSRMDERDARDQAFRRGLMHTFAAFRGEVQQLLGSHIENRPLVDVIPQGPYFGNEGIPNPTHPPKKSQTRAAILDLLRYDSEICELDLDNALHDIHRSSPDVQNRARALIAEPKLAAWATNPTSAVLLINGNHAASQRHPPTSFVAAKLVDSLGVAAQKSGASEYATIRLYFFCGQHTRSRTDELAGPVGMLRTLVAQLVEAYEDFKLRKPLHLLEAAADEMDVEILWAVFESLILQLPDAIALFVILESVTEYETSDWRQDTRYIVEQLVEYCRQSLEEERCVVKVFLTSPLTSHVLHHQLEREEMVNMPDRVQAYGGFSDKAWTLSGAAQAIEDKPGMQ